jgi:pSer/pThr/pTyr-binding forkhead associated (FHA) protein
MAFGRLEVYYPDGAFKTFLLSAPNISVGRSTGNMIALDVDGISRYHLSIAHKDGETRITDLDSANGTFIDSERLTPQEARTLYGGEEIQIGEVRLVYHSFDDTPTRPVVVPEDTTRRVEIEEVDFTLDVMPPDQAVSPGAHISAQLTITNTGDEPERYLVDVGGLPMEWVRIDRRELEIGAGKAGDVVINFKPRRRSDSTPGDYSVTAIVRLKDKPTAELRTSFILRVLPFGGFGMALEQRQIKSSENFRLHVHNQGSANLPLSLTARELDDGMRITIPQPRFTLAPGQRMVVQGEVHPQKAHIFGEPRRFALDLLVRSGDASGFLAAVRLYMTEKPPLPSWSAYAIGGVAVAALALILVGLAILLQPPPVPVITSFQASAAVVRQGQPITFTWDVENANDVDLVINGVPVLENVPANQYSAQIDSSLYTGELAIRFVADNGTFTAETSTSVIVTPSLSVSYFTIEPPTLVRYVAQTMTLNWSVSGAITTRISGIEAFSSTPLQTDYGASGTVSVVGIPTTPLSLTITLTAVSDTGEAVQQSIDVELIDPQCTASTGDVALYGAPDGRGQIVATIPQGTTVVIDGQDASSQWLRVRLSGGANGWGRIESLICENTFNMPDLLKILDIPTAMPEVVLTATPTPTPSATPTATNTMITPLNATFTATSSNPLVIVGTPTITTQTPAPPLGP